MDSKTVRNRSGNTGRRIGQWVAVFGILLLGWTPVWAAASAGSVNGAGASWFVDMNRFAQSAHAALTCEACHGTMQENGRRHPDPEAPAFLSKPATRAFDYSRCRTCHQVAHDRYLEGAHARALAEQTLEKKASPAAAKPTKPAPTCGECHSSHYERSHRSRVEIGRQMVDTCGRCHEAHAASYMKNIHGKVGVNLGNPQSAYCTDCHGAHANTALAKPERALPACQRCHAKADAAFAGFVIHDTVALAGGDGDGDDTSKTGSILWIHRIRLAAIAVVVLSLAFFFGHSCLWLLREFHEKLRKH